MLCEPSQMHAGDCLCKLRKLSQFIPKDSIVKGNRVGFFFSLNYSVKYKWHYLRHWKILNSRKPRRARQDSLGVALVCSCFVSDLQPLEK